ncbi:anthranilate synthase component I [Candidatus Pelagibacter communis]|uniref:anthranilate synthase component I n=1 Tax=Pelagibacter ubique TaxID=198252 RepID=UPI00094D5E8F|nr:anthranilate synthase component I [Candidatus Pelagibacter ubique]
MLNISFEKFKKTHKKKINQVLYYELKSNNSKEVENLINNFLQDKNSFVFESVEKGVIKGRYTIFGKNPDKIWEFNNENIYYLNKNKKKKINGDPVKVINNIIKNFNFKTPKKLPPLCSLLAGYFSYDTIRYFEKIKDNCIDDLKIPDIRIIRPTTLVIHDNLQKKIFFIKNCFSDKKISNYEKKYTDIQDELNNIIIQSKISTSYSDKKLVKKKIKSNISKKQFLDNVKKAKKYIQIGDIFQVVLSQRFETKLTKKPLSIYKRLRLTNPSPFMFYFNFNDFQIIGASPEILVRLRDNKVTIRPIAGTRPRGKNLSEDNFYKKDLLSDKKEISEHLMLLDLGRNDIGKISKINTVKVTEQFKIEKYSHVMHIVSNVTGEFDKKKSKYDTLMAGFPAGTVSGAPKIRAMEIIDELEKNKRKIYAGGIGYFSANGDFDTCIALRTALAKNGKYYVQAGAGIVADSIPEKEFQETVNKSKALIKALD